MEHFELVEKLVNTFGVSYEKAKEALEASNWDAIDAAIYLEREKKGEPQPVQQEIPEEPKQEPVREEAQPDVNTGTKGSTSNGSTYNGSTFNGSTFNTGNFSSSTKSALNDLKEEGGKFFKTIWDFLSLNSFVVKKSSGEVFLDIPIWLMATLLCAFFWAVIMILGIVFIMGYRFSFKGPQLGKKNIKNTVDHVESATEDFVEKVKNCTSPDNEEPAEEAVKDPEIIIDQKPEQSPEQQETTDNNDKSEENSTSDTENAA